MNESKTAIGTECPGCAKVFRTPLGTWYHLRGQHPELEAKYYYPLKSAQKHSQKPDRSKRVLTKVNPKPEVMKDPDGQDAMPLNYCPCCGTNLAVIATVLAAAGKVVARG